MTDTAEKHLARLASAAARQQLADTGLGWTPVDVAVCAAIRFKRVAGDPPSIVGLVGGASSGKSTIFNSIVGRPVSCISAHAHETVGPIAAVPDSLGERVENWAAEGLLFGDYEISAARDGQMLTGVPGELALSRHEQPAANVILLDTPDVTSQMSADEGFVTRTLLPWFDGLIVVADEERWFDDSVFAGMLGLARNFGPRIWIVFNRTEPNAEAQRPDERLAEQAARHRAADHCVSPFVEGVGYRPIDPAARSRIERWLGGLEPTSRLDDLSAQLQRRSADVLATNVKRAEHHRNMCRAVDDELATLAGDARLSADLLTPDERRLLGIGHRYMPLYDTLAAAWRRLPFFGKGLRSSTDAINFEKREAQLAETLRDNLEQRFSRAADRIDEIVACSEYLAGCDTPYNDEWTLPPFDATEWASRIRAHVEAWKKEAAAQARSSDAVALPFGVILLADLLFLGGAGTSIVAGTAWVAGLFGGKAVVRALQKSRAFEEYQTTVRAYQSFVREALTAQWEQNRARIPQRHLPMSDPIVESLMFASKPGRRA